MNATALTPSPICLGTALFGTTIARSDAFAVLDAFTDGGLGIGFWIPFSDERLFAPFRPIMTSSIDPMHAFGARGMRVLANEALWIGLPVASVVCLVMLGRVVAARVRMR